METSSCTITDTQETHLFRKEYTGILTDIRNMQELTDHHREILKECSLHQLLQIIEIYNLVIKNVNYIFS